MEGSDSGRAGVIDRHGCWQHRFGRWELWWVNRTVAIVHPLSDGTARITLNALKLWQVKEVTAANVDQAKMYAERWCAARLFEGVPIKEGVARFRGQDQDAEANPPPEG